jgi:hypothetical protein
MAPHPIKPATITQTWNFSGMDKAFAGRNPRADNLPNRTE